jgi:hypothetical protein
VPTDSLPEGPLEYAISTRFGGEKTTYPDGVRRVPWDWDFHAERLWQTTLVRPRTPLRLFSPGEDAARMAFTRIGDGGRSGIFRVLASAATGQPVLHLALPVNVGGITPDDYTASLVVKDLIAGRGETLAAATGVRVRLRGIGPRQRLHLTLMEADGTSWSAVLEPGPQWEERTLPLAAFRTARGVKLPQGFPGNWNYWVGPAEGRGGPGDALRLPAVERLQLSLRHAEGVAVQPDGYGVEVEAITLVFE